MAETAITSRTCRQCGATIFPDGTAGFCGACLLETGLDPASTTASVLMDFGEYELLEEVGRGGQGVVILAVVDAALGREEDALRESARAIELSEPLERSQIAMDQANVYCWLGQRGRALEELAKIARTAVGVSYGDLRFNPAWDSLRDDPRFAQILADAATPIAL